MHRGEGFSRTGRALTKARFIVALIALFTFTLQTYVVQTHIHTAAFETGGTGSLNHPSPLGNKDNPDDCPICQAFAMAGSAVTPALIVLALALAFVDAAPFFALRSIAGPLLARSWQSRAPPRH
jgi:hypothetical protein